MSAEAISGTYEQFVTRLGFFNPPKFSIVPKAKIGGAAGEHKRKTFWRPWATIKLANDIPSRAEAERILVHELSHHALSLAGYSGHGHAWPKLLQLIQRLK